MANDRIASVLHSAIAEEMRHIRILLEQLAELLASDEVFAGKYLEQFQTFDLLIQCADESAAVLDRLAEGALSHEAIEPVRLTVVQDRLRTALDQAA